MRVLPSFTKQGIVLPWIDVAVYPAVWLVLITMLLVGTGSGTMDYTPIPSEVLVPTVISIVLASLLLFAVLYLVAYQEKKSKTLELKAEALQNGIAVDEISLAKVESFNNIYVCALLIGATITAICAYVAMISVIPNQLELVSVVDYIVYSVIAVIVAGLVLDKVFVHPIADGTFKSKVIDPLTDSIIDEFQNGDAEDSASTLTTEQLSLLINALSAINTSK